MLPIITLSLLGVINLFIGLNENRKTLMPLAFLFVAISLAAVVLDANLSIDWPNIMNNNMLVMDTYSMVFSGIMLFTALMIVPLAGLYTTMPKAQPAEYYSIMMFSLVGAIMMVSFGNLLMLFLGIEILSIPLYILTGADKRNIKSNEAALKYLLMGAFATGIFLFGVAMMYGATMSFDISAIAAATEAPGFADSDSFLLYVLGTSLILIGLLFKVSAAPFHFWTADVYEGAPTVFTAFMATIVKTAGFAAIVRMLSIPLASQHAVWVPILMAMAVITLLVGNTSATVQHNVKRMLAFSSVSHAGYLLLALTTGAAAAALEPVLFYSLSYSLGTVTSFTVLMLVSKSRGKEDIKAFNGVAKTNPFLAFAMTVSMLSLAGIPLTAGFFGKFFIFRLAIEHTGLLVFAVVMSAVGLYYYFKPIIAMYSKQPEVGTTAISVNTSINIMLVVTTVLTILLGVAPSLFTNLF